MTSINLITYKRPIPPPLTFSGIVLIVGNPNEGKTLVATRILLTAYERGEKIYANYHLLFPHTPILNTRDLETVTDGIMCVDEAHSIANSRRGTAGETLLLDLVIQEARKRKLNVLLVTQKSHMIDKRLRMKQGVADYIIYPKISSFFTTIHKNGFVEQIPLVVTLHIYDIRGKLHKQRFPVTPALLKAYDTHAPIYPFEFIRDDEFGKQNPIAKGIKKERMAMSVIEQRKGWLCKEQEAHSHFDFSVTCLALKKDFLVDVVSLQIVQSAKGMTIMVGSGKLIDESRKNTYLAYFELGGLDLKILHLSDEFFKSWRKNSMEHNYRKKRPSKYLNLKYAKPFHMPIAMWQAKIEAGHDV